MCCLAFTMTLDSFLLSSQSSNGLSLKFQRLLQSCVRSRIDSHVPRVEHDNHVLTSIKSCFVSRRIDHDEIASPGQHLGPDVGTGEMNVLDLSDEHGRGGRVCAGQVLRTHREHDRLPPFDAVTPYHEE